MIDKQSSFPWMSYPVGEFFLRAEVTVPLLRHILHRWPTKENLSPEKKQIVWKIRIQKGIINVLWAIIHAKVK